MRRLALCTLCLASMIVAGCQGGSVSDQDVKSWSQAHDANGKPIQESQDQGR